MPDAVTGIGGVFFRSDDPEALARWYASHLDIDLSQGAPWMQQAGPTVFAPFPQNSDYFEADRQWMLNFRVADLAGLLARLERSGITSETRADWDGDGSYGRFG